MNDVLDGYLRKMESELKESNFEDSDFDFSEFENIVGRKITPDEKRRIIQRRKPTIVISGDGKKNVTVGQSDMVTSLIANSVGDLNLYVKRLTNTIAEPLPFPLFGLTDYQNQFRTILTPFLPAGVTISAVRVDAQGNIEIDYASGANTDTVEVGLRTKNNNYSYFLQSMNQNYFRTSYILYSVSDLTRANAQFSHSLNFGNISALGRKDSTELVPNSRKMTWNYQGDRIDLVLNDLRISADFAIVGRILDVANLEIYFDVFISHRVNLNKL